MYQPTTVDDAIAAVKNYIHLPELTDESLMPFGKYMGLKMKDVPHNWYVWMYEQTVAYPAVHRQVHWHRVIVYLNKIREAQKSKQL